MSDQKREMPAENVSNEQALLLENRFETSLKELVEYNFRHLEGRKNQILLALKILLGHVELLIHNLAEQKQAPEKNDYSTYTNLISSVLSNLKTHQQITDNEYDELSTTLLTSIDGLSITTNKTIEFSKLIMILQVTLSSAIKSIESGETLVETTSKDTIEQLTKKLNLQLKSRIEKSPQQANMNNALEGGSVTQVDDEAFNNRLAQLRARGLFGRLQARVIHSLSDINSKKLVIGGFIDFLVLDVTMISTQLIYRLAANATLISSDVFLVYLVSTFGFATVIDPLIASTFNYSNSVGYMIGNTIFSGCKKLVDYGRSCLNYISATPTRENLNSVNTSDAQETSLLINRNNTYTNLTPTLNISSNDNSTKKLLENSDDNSDYAKDSQKYNEKIPLLKAIIEKAIDNSSNAVTKEENPENYSMMDPN